MSQRMCTIHTQDLGSFLGTKKAEEGPSIHCSYMCIIKHVTGRGRGEWCSYTWSCDTQPSV